MSNETHDTHETHDPQEPTGARLSEAQVADFARLTAEPTPTWDILRTDVRQLEVYALDLRVGMSLALADRAALVAEVARLQGELEAREAEYAALESSHSDALAINDWMRDHRDAFAADVAAMRPLVEALANLNLSVGGRYLYVFGPGLPAADRLHEQARALVATWAAGQTPATPEGGDA